VANKVRHPGEVIREDILPNTGLGITKAAAVLGVGRFALSALLNEQSELSLEMALRIEKAFKYPMRDLMLAQLEWSIEKTRKRRKALGVRRFTMPQIASASA
jgi:addiction module HigA family antidote